MSLHGFSYTICDFATNKNGKEIRSITNNTKLSVWLTNLSRPLWKRRHKKSRIGLLHRNQFPEGIQLSWTIISQIYRKKKICLKSVNDTNIYRLSLWYNNNERLKLPSHTVTLHSAIRQLYTRCTQKPLNDIQTVIQLSQPCLLKGKKHNASEFKS